MTDRTVHIVLAADARYAMPLAVAISSIAFHADRRRPFVFHVIHDDIEGSIRARVHRSMAAAGHPDATISWIDAQPQRLQHLPLVHSYMSSSIYARLLITDLLPVDVPRALYLDADTVTLEDLGILFDHDMKGHSLAAVRDRIGCVSADGGLVNFRELGLPAEAPYFNSGVLLMDLGLWRTRSTAKQVISYLERHRDLLRMGDQDGLNAVLAHDWTELPFRWNWQIMPRIHRSKVNSCWSPVSNERSVVHFSTSEKPWLAGCDVEERPFFFEALDRTEWAGWRVPGRQERWVRLKRRLRSYQARARDLFKAGRGDKKVRSDAAPLHE